MEGVSFSVEKSENLGILGPSGSGKTTLLRLLAGLELPDSGQVLIDGREVTHVPPHQRRMGLMFQEYALFPHRDVFGNVSFGLRMDGLGRAAMATRVAEVLQLVGLEGFERRDVGQLSGGERQRVALARSLAPRPRLLMLDEPLGALDRSLRERLIDELPRILRDAGVTAITVTHDQEEAFAIADRIVLMRDGRVEQIGAPEELYQRPAGPWAARFLGLTNLLPGLVLAPGLVETALGVLRVEGPAPVQHEPGSDAELLVRPEAARFDRDGPNVVTGVVSERSFRGGHYRVTVRFVGGRELAFAVTGARGAPLPGETTVLSLDPLALSLLRPAQPRAAD
jgi:ABC-type Fe3+/spermidine/putrescine transport system ATPase subunit